MFLRGRNVLGRGSGEQAETVRKMRQRGSTCTEAGKDAGQGLGVNCEPTSGLILAEFLDELSEATSD